MLFNLKINANRGIKKPSSLLENTLKSILTGLEPMSSHMISDSVTTKYTAISVRIGTITLNTDRNDNWID
jgi:hypothetical protein